MYYERSSDVRKGLFNLLSWFRRNSHHTSKFQRSPIQQWMLGIVNLNHVGITTLLSCYQLFACIMNHFLTSKNVFRGYYPNLLYFFRRNSHFKYYIERKNESGIVKVDYTANITHIETRLLRSCGLFLRAVIIWEEISFERIGTLTKFTVSPQFQTKALKEFVSIHDMKYVLSKNTPAMKVKLNSIVAWKSCQLEFEIPILCRSNKSYKWNWYWTSLQFKNVDN